MVAIRGTGSVGDWREGDGVAPRDARGRRAGLYCFRRGSATGMLDLGLDAKTAQLQLGHSDVATTLRHYTDRGLKEQGAAAELLARALGSCHPRGSQDRQELCTSRHQNGIPSPGDSGGGSQKTLDRPTAAGDIESTSRPHAAHCTTQPRSSEPRRAFVAGREESRGDERPGSGDQCGPTLLSGAGMSEWARQGSNLSPPPADIPPHAAALMHRVLDLVERFCGSDRKGPTDERGKPPT